MVMGRPELTRLYAAAIDAAGATRSNSTVKKASSPAFRDCEKDLT